MGYQNSGWARVICGEYTRAECGRIRFGGYFYKALIWRGFIFWKDAELVAQAEVYATNSAGAHGGQKSRIATDCCSPKVVAAPGRADVGLWGIPRT